MPLYTKSSLDNLRQRIELIDVLSMYLDLKRTGSSYQALCPFHDEKSPSFKVQRADTHYHCYGCGAHGDAIKFLMDHVQMAFTEAVEFLAERFHVVLEKEKQGEEKGLPKAGLKKTLHLAKQLYQCYLLFTEEGHQALHYLYQRGLNLDFILHFQLGFVPSSLDMTVKALEKRGIEKKFIEEVGLIKNGSKRPFFADRIVFPILDPMQATLAFSGRKFKEDTFGGKYINTSETELFKKGNLLFGLNYSRRRMAKEKKALIVEGQIDALSLIQKGFDYTVAPLGTAFGHSHVRILQQLGVQTVYLAMDADVAGREAALKTGDLLQSQGIEVFILPLPQGTDPDTFIRQEGIEAFQNLFQQKEEFLPFMVDILAQGKNLSSPAGKNQIISELRERLQKWESPVMVHESLKKLSFLLQVPQEMLGIGMVRQTVQKQRRGGEELIQSVHVNYDRILEGDLIRWLILLNGEETSEIAFVYSLIKEDDFKIKPAQQLFKSLLLAHTKHELVDLLSLASFVEELDTQEFVDEIFEKKVPKEKGELFWKETLQKLMDRNWMEKRERIRREIQSGQHSEEKVLDLAKEFDLLKKNTPNVLQKLEELKNEQ